MGNEYVNTLLVQQRQRELQEELQRWEWRRQTSKQHPRRNILTIILNLVGFGS